MFLNSTMEVSATWRAKAAWAGVATSAFMLPAGRVSHHAESEHLGQDPLDSVIEASNTQWWLSTASRSVATAAGLITDIPAVNAGTAASTASRSERTNPVTPA